jgi:hypothetical protein
MSEWAGCKETGSTHARGHLGTYFDYHFMSSIPPECDDRNVLSDGRS